MMKSLPNLAGTAVKGVMSRCLLLGLSLLSFASSLSLSTRQKRSFLSRVDRFLTKLQKPELQHKDYLYLHDNYAPVSKIFINEPVSVVEGLLPPDLDGMVCRNGPNPAHLTKRYHWFDGDAMLHNLRIADGKAYYTNQFVPSVRYDMEQILGESFFPTLGEYTGFWGFVKIIIHPAMLRPLVPKFALTSAPPNTSCLMYRNKFYCLNEGSVPFECRILPDGRIEGIGFEFFDDVLDYPVSAHPRIDENGDLLFHSYSTYSEYLNRDGPIKVGRFSAKTGKVESYFGPAKSRQKHVSFTHSMSYTRQYMIVMDCSVHFDTKALFEGGSYFRAKSDHTLKFGIIPKTATSEADVIWMDTGKPGVVVHPLNSWEEDDGTIVIWTPLFDYLDLDLEKEHFVRSRMVEFRLNPKTGHILEQVIDDTLGTEFSVVPTMGRFSRYGYTAIQDPSTPGEGSFAGFCIWDMMDRTLKATKYYHGYGGEPVLLRSSIDDDKIYVGVYVQSGMDSYFEVYDGLTTEMKCRLKMPGRVPYGFHGLWVTGEELRGHFEHHGIKDVMREPDLSEVK